MILNRKISQDYLSESRFISLIKRRTIGFRFFMQPVKSPRTALYSQLACPERKPL